MINCYEPFLKRIKEIKEQIQKDTNGLIEYEEFIAIPHFDFIILRFNLNKEIITLKELDEYESYLYKIVGDDFLVDFMGSVYKKVGVDFSI